jgi:hypothetical protein
MAAGVPGGDLERLDAGSRQKRPCSRIRRHAGDARAIETLLLSEPRTQLSARPPACRALPVEDCAVYHGGSLECAHDPRMPKELGQTVLGPATDETQANWNRFGIETFSHPYQAEGEETWREDFSY